LRRDETLLRINVTAERTPSLSALIKAPTGKGCSVGRITIVRYGER
jgi:hypothetical protein